MTPAKGSWVQTGIMNFQPGGAAAAQEEGEDELGFVEEGLTSETALQGTKVSEHYLTLL